MELALPDPLPDYFSAQNAHGVEAMVECFAPDAVVRDEGRDYAGRDAIRGWKEATVAKYGISVEPLESDEQGGLRIVVARVTGNFPGSPANLTYSFSLANGLIRTLEIN